MEVRDFEYLVALADLGSVTKAADQVYLTQPAISKFIHNKEKELGILLFNRIGKQLFPTYAGEKCIEAARKILTINTQLNDDIMLIANQDTSRIRIGFLGSWSKFFLEKIYPAFHHYYTDIDLQIYDVNSAESLERINSGLLDIAIISSAWEHHSQYTSTTLKNQQVVLGVHKNDPIMEKAVRTPEHPYPYLDLQYLKDASFIMRYTNSKTKRDVIDLFNFHGIKPHIVLETNSRDSALCAINLGHGVSFIADDAAELYVYENIRYLSFPEENIRKTYLQIIHNKGTQLSVAEEELIDTITGEYEKIVIAAAQSR
jgi:DNA-binding transcriptional LysR family regulator